MPTCREWTVAATPTRVQLNGVARGRNQWYAVGNRGVLLEQSTGAWERVRSDGVDDRGRGLHDIAATDHGRRLWCCGVRGTLGYYDPRTGENVSYSQPYDLGSNFREVAVSGVAGVERVHVADDDGRVVRLSVGAQQSPVRGVAVPGPNDPITAALDVGEMLFAADASGRLYQSPDGRRWRRRRLVTGVVMALAVDADGLAAVTREGAVHTGIRSFSEPPDGFEALPNGIRPKDASGRGDTATIVGDGGNLLLRESGPRFEGASVGTTGGLSAVELGEDGSVVAVGADGTVVEGRATH